ncbi:hypothetical protein HYU22_03005 [Candidatus Woesearchaeota archaeon]|nr:hypothetical protein [Candidatus Woesearchaeota archaeon]
MNYKKIVRQGALLGLGVAAYAKEEAEKLGRELLKGGHVNSNEGKKLVRAIYKEADTSRRNITNAVEKELKRLVNTSKGKKR